MLTSWEPSAFGLALPVALAAGYAALVLWARARGQHTPVWRVVTFAAGDAVLLWCLVGGPAASRQAAAWVGALGVGLVSAVVPLGLALGDPVGVWERAAQRRARWLHGVPARVVMFPLVATVASAVLLTVAFTSTWYAAAQRADVPWALLQLAVLVTGLLVNLPLLTEDLLPSWCGPGARTMFAFADGLVDAVPGIVVMTTVDKWAGGALLSVAEAVGVPMILAVFVIWVRSDAAEARAVDAILDAEAAVAGSPTAPAGGTTAAAPALGAAPAGGLWWEADPQLSARFHRPPTRPDTDPAERH
jgi:putative copper resistance protein D